LDLAKLDLGTPFASPSARAREAARQLMLALNEGDYDKFQKATDVPFTLSGFMTFQTRAEFEQLFRPALDEVKRREQKIAFKITKVVRVEEYAKTASEPERTFLKGLRSAETRVAMVEGVLDGRQEVLALVVRVRGARGRVIGFGEPNRR